MAVFFAILAFISVGLAVVFSMRIVHEVSRRGIKVHYALLRVYLFRYISQYKDLTIKETGKPGPLYAPCVVSYFMALVFAVVYLIVR